MMLKLLTILAGTHMAAAVMPALEMPSVTPRALPIQYGPPPGYYGMPGPYVPRGPGWYGPRYMPQDRYMRPDDFYTMRRWEYELRRPPRGYGPPMGW